MSLKHQYVINLAVAGVLVIPAVSRTAGSDDGVVAALDDTVRALEDLAGLRTRIEQRDPSALDFIVGATEAAEMGSRQLDELLVSLRDDVSRLHMALDATGSQPGPDDPHTKAPSAGSPTHGLTPEMRSRIAGSPTPLNHLSFDAARRGGPKSFESDGYSADAVRHGRLFFRAERFAEAIQILEPHTELPEAKYWVARAYAELDRDHEAVDLLRELVDDPSAPTLAKRAKKDLDFLTWKQEFEQLQATEKQK